MSSRQFQVDQTATDLKAQGGRETSCCLHFGEGDICSAWKAFTNDSPKAAFTKNTSSQSHVEENLPVDTLFFSGNSFSPSLKNTNEKVITHTPIFRSEFNPQTWRRRDNFFKVLPEPSTDQAKEEESKNKDDDVETITDTFPEKEEFSEYSDDSGEDPADDFDSGEIEPAVVPQKSLKPYEPFEPKKQPMVSNMKPTYSGHLDPAVVIMCPWKKLAIVLFIFSTVVLMYLVSNQTELNSGFTSHLTTFSNMWKEPEPLQVPMEFPSFVERCRKVMSSNRFFTEVLADVDIIGVITLVMIVFFFCP